ncbi:efflux RND transporter periplasmic adaptor subunit [Leadbettera azotonutricia]|uniref:Membrane fusion protein n=1 Tax=Leadbettera azotonutricia (strain ATCC BAA-888 / DSM 13862 / ZAS-9) TaxID=545695 RepID=F5YAE8_LEAAZ|nr:efflux RND transporter periplasmic adaptor subunit [Leadbettera azotonutricia]AEF83133.1 membrane fusion protein [Leadbettera azotonutricia ZAS-9]
MIKGDMIAKVIVIILIAVFLGVAAFNMLAPKASPAAGGPPAGMQPAGNSSGRPAANAITVSAKTLQPETIRQVVKLNGDVSSQSEVNVMPDTSGKITRIVKNLGDTVQQGEIIAYIDPSRAGQSYSENPVTSPVGGTITSLPVTTGGTVSSATVIAVIGSLDNLKITIYVAEKYSAYLRRGLPAIVSFASAPGEEFAASVSAISPVVNNKNRTIETTLLLAKRDGRIKQGMFASVYLVIREENRALVIPRGAIKNYNGDPTVYVMDENSIARRIPITLGLTNDSDVQIISGLKEGDRIITAGSVTDGSPVRIVAAGLSLDSN